ncbi:sigma-70 family RNA polymerase sigma factor [Ruixingdingia sedimenti]|uniref:RNA polymerase sigma factor n=1 Tax=Ruixingdingia sedimenti TaxID=3073604 RepID=A0ABU1F9H6_9RHOB|nr:sigma-70 family RNA polymerase sigma factor [Xinfangfangia sp. LG-4]MDR5653550.1 sigma-70 family RNA polymerase sigma factor [Xinfangfangia sp. LG-4]
MTDCSTVATPGRAHTKSGWATAAHLSRPAVSEAPRPKKRPRPAGETGDDIVAYIPALRVFARSLCKDAVEADDLVQETLLRAIENIRLYESGTNLRAWLFTIMRNKFYSNWAKRSRERTGEADCVSSIPAEMADTQLWHLRRLELEQALKQLPVHYRETIILVSVLGESYLHAAEVLGCDIGTIKSRVNRARAALREKLGETAGE